ncbi:MAG: 5-formyltetrahydrofolate cyclo-ligase [Paramuribaculum sp.]|nr:5-formyltetrahydrofolate cyclo-ligase [Paramuribaculum sp.]
MDKSEIRCIVRARKSRLTDSEKFSAAAKVWKQLEQLDAFSTAQKVLMYHSLPDELCSHEFIDKWHGHKQLFLPRVNGESLDILPYRPTCTHHGAFHIEEPDGDDFADVNQMDIIVVPAMAYDRKGNRVGRGKGYYDRLLSSTDALKVGVAYACQLVDEINVESTDIPVDIVITEISTYMK